MATDLDRREVVVRDIDMPFFSMVRFMVKWAIAAIPAIVILSIVGVVAASLTFGGLGFLKGLRVGDRGYAPRSLRDASDTSSRTAEDPSGIRGSEKVYLDGERMLFHKPRCPDVRNLSAPMQYAEDGAGAMGYRPHECMQRPD